MPAVIAKCGGKVLARGGRCQIMEEPVKFLRFVVIEFPRFEQGEAWFTSTEYDATAAFRRSGAGEVETIIVDGGDAMPRPWEASGALPGTTGWIGAWRASAPRERIAPRPASRYSPR